MTMDERQIVRRRADVRHGQTSVRSLLREQAVARALEIAVNGQTRDSRTREQLTDAELGAMRALLGGLEQALPLAGLILHGASPTKHAGPSARTSDR